MVYFTDLYSILECIYLGSTLGDSIKECLVHINPGKVTYLSGKIVIINILNYPERDIDTLLRNNCKVISRTKSYSSDVDFQPYILRPNFNITWNGDEIIEGQDITDYCTFDESRMRLLFPKIQDAFEVTDTYGNLTSLGWALQQVGDNIVRDTPFIDLDILKTKKLRF